MLREISKIGLISIPAFIACHLIQENNDKIKKYCPVIKFNNSKSSSNTTSKKE